MPCVQPESILWSRQWERFFQQVQPIYRTHIIITDPEFSVLLCCPPLQLQWKILDHYVSRLVRALTCVEIWPTDCHLKGKIIFGTRPLDDRLDGSWKIEPLADLVANWAPHFLGPNLPFFLANWAPENWPPWWQIGPRQIGPLGGKLGHSKLGPGKLGHLRHSSPPT